MTAERYSRFLEAQTIDELIAVAGKRMCYYNTERRHSSIDYMSPLANKGASVRILTLELMLREVSPCGQLSITHKAWTTLRGGHTAHNPTTMGPLGSLNTSRGSQVITYLNMVQLFGVTSADQNRSLELKETLDGWGSTIVGGFR